jgi:hypothetical protein
MVVVVVVEELDTRNSFGFLPLNIFTVTFSSTAEQFDVAPPK